MIAAWGLGLVVGPAIGGVLTDPATVPQWRHSAYPYLLPSIVCAAAGLVATVHTAIYLPETRFASHVVRAAPCTACSCAAGQAEIGQEQRICAGQHCNGDRVGAAERCYCRGAR